MASAEAVVSDEIQILFPRLHAGGGRSAGIPHKLSEYNGVIVVPGVRTIAEVTCIAVLGPFLIPDGVVCR